MDHQQWETIKFTKKQQPKTTNTPREDDDELPKIVKISSANKDIIQKARLAKKLTQKKLGEAINVNENTIKLLEAGTGQPDFNTLTKIEKVLGVKLDKTKKQKKQIK